MSHLNYYSPDRLNSFVSQFWRELLVYCKAFRSKPLLPFHKHLNKYLRPQTHDTNDFELVTAMTHPIRSRLNTSFFDI